MLELPGGRALIDTTPELRLQMLREGYPFADAVLYTHHHADHLLGMDDVRLFSRHIGGPVPVYCEEEVEEAIRRVFSYAFTEQAARTPSGGIPRLAFRRIAPREPFDVLGQRVMPLRLEHGRFRVLGFRFGDLAYCTDVNRVPEESWPLLEGLDILILDALRYTPHPTHFSLEEALAVVERLRPRQTYLTHLSHEFDHGTTGLALPPGVALAYDGLALTF